MWFTYINGCTINFKRVAIKFCILIKQTEAEIEQIQLQKSNSIPPSTKTPQKPSKINNATVNAALQEHVDQEEIYDNYSKSKTLRNLY